MKKILIFLGIVAIFSIGLIYYNSYTNAEKLKGNLYGDKELNQATIDQLDDKNYQNIILPEELNEKIKQGDIVLVYFFSPTCTHCVRATPNLLKASKKNNIYIDQYNLLEFEKGFNDYSIKGTPTLVAFKNGKEISRIMGYKSEKEFSKWIVDNIK